MIKFNEVTPLSKLLAIIFFILVLPVLSFYIGKQYEQATSLNIQNNTSLNTNNIPSTNQNVAKTDTSTLKIYKNDTYHFQFQYPDTARLLETKVNNPDHLIIHAMNDAGFFSIAVILDKDTPYPLPRMPWVLSEDEETINGIKMVKTLYGTNPDLKQNSYVYLDYSFELDGQMYEFIINSKESNNIMDVKSEAFLKQMISSLKKI
jgi:hypothetical protein